MFRKQALQTTLRTPRRSLLFLLLLALISALLASSLGMSASLSRALSLCRENYSTIGLAEYISGGYPELSALDSAAGQAADALSAAVAPDDALLYYEPTRMALGDTDGLASRKTFDGGVLVLRVKQLVGDPANGSRNDFYYAVVEEAPFSAGATEGKLICVYTEDALRINHIYLAHGSFFDGSSAYPSFGLAPYTAPDGSLTLPACQDITSEGGYTLPQDSPYLTVAQTYAVESRALTLWCSDHPQDLYPFHENVLTLTEGDWYTEGGCLLSQSTAQALGLSVGDTFPLRTAARTDLPFSQSYQADRGFDAETICRVDGLFAGSDDWKDMVFLPVSEDLPTAVGAYTVGQFRLVNGQAQDYLDALTLPAGVRVTVYDQGYAAAESSLGTMLRSVGVISAVCLAAGLAFLLLFAYLLIFRQQGVALTMERLGVARRDILRYDVFCTLFPALPGCLAGFLVSLAACQALERVVAAALEDSGSADLHFSNAALSVSRSAAEFLTAPSPLLLLALCAAVLVLALAFGLLFGVLALRRKHQRRRFLPARDSARSRSLRGGSLKYALLSLCRGGFRTLVPVIALLCAAVLFCRLAAVTESARTGLQALQQESSVRGYLTDISGRSLSGLLLDESAAQALAAIPGVSDVTLCRSSHYDLLYVDHQAYTDADGSHDGYTDGPGPHPRTYGSYGWEIFMDYLRSRDEIIFTSSLHGAPEFLYSQSVDVEYLPGWDESFLSAPRGEEDACILPSSLMEEHHIALGDTVTLEMPGNFDSFLMRFRVVGRYVQEGAANHIYASLNLFEPWTGQAHEKGIIYVQRSVEGGLRTTFYVNGPMTYQSAAFTVPDCSDLESVKSALYQAGFSATSHLRSLRSFVTINDASYLSALHAAQQRLWYMERLFPLIDALAVALAFLLGRLLLGRRAGELRTLRSMGVSPASAFWSLYWEQLLLVLLGAALGTGACLLLGEGSSAGGAWLLAFSLSYLLGALTAIRRSNRRHILKNRREQEA